MKLTLAWIGCAGLWALASWAWATAIAKSREAHQRELAERMKAGRRHHPDVEWLERHVAYQLPATWTPQEYPERFKRIDAENERLRR